MDKDPTPQQLINLFLFELCHYNATFDDAPSALSESEIITLKVALLDGWTNIGLFEQTDSRSEFELITKRSFRGNNSGLESKYGNSIPDYANDLSAISDTLQRFNLLGGVIDTLRHYGVMPTAEAYCKVILRLNNSL
jgi:hypothetical protein